MTTPRKWSVHFDDKNENIYISLTDKLDFWSAYFYVVPVLMISLGVYTFLVCIFGFLISGSENRGLIAGFAVLLAIAFLAQLASIFTALELRTTVAESQVGAALVYNDLNTVRIP